MNFSERAVHEYMAQVLGLLSLPDMKVKRNEKGESWSAQVDFLALDFEARRILLVEATANKSFPQWLVNKVRNAKDTKTIEWHVRTVVLKGKIQDDYRLAWLLIVPEKHVARLAEATVGSPCEVISLEGILRKLADSFGNQDSKASS